VAFQLVFYAFDKKKWCTFRANIATKKMLGKDDTMECACPSFTVLMSGTVSSDMHQQYKSACIIAGCVLKLPSWFIPLTLVPEVPVEAEGKKCPNEKNRSPRE
jgi:hypothetical protein